MGKLLNYLFLTFILVSEHYHFDQLKKNLTHDQYSSLSSLFNSKPAFETM